MRTIKDDLPLSLLVARIIADFQQQPLVFQPTNRDPWFCSLDLNLHYGPHYGALSYALCTLDSERSREVNVLAGGDDGLRVWLNGKLVLERPGLQVIPIDSLSGKTTLAAGKNTLLVEIAQGPGGVGVLFAFDVSGWHSPRARCSSTNCSLMSDPWSRQRRSTISKTRSNTLRSTLRW